MGRALKKGFEYFPLDTSFFEDIKVRKLLRRGSPSSIPVYICALGLIFKEGYYLTFDEDFSFIVSEKTGVEEEEVKKSIEICVSVGLFDKELFSKGILTSVGIQKRYRAICTQSKRVSIIEEYNLLDDLEDEEIISEVSNKADTEDEPEVISSEQITSEKHLFGTIVTSEDQSPEKMQQRKVKESIYPPPIPKGIVPPLIDSEEKKSETTTKSVAVKKTIEQRKKEFGVSLIPYVDKYGQAMIREFFDYWTEHNKDGLKMRYEMEKVFDIARRLGTWQRNNEKGYGSGRVGYKKGSTISEAVQATVIQSPEMIDMTKLLNE